MVDKRIEEYTELVGALQCGHFEAEVETEPNDSVGKLGRSLAGLAKTLEQSYDDQNKIAAITEKINQGLYIDDIMSYVYEAFREVIPYNRVGLALFKDEGRRLSAHWARSDASDIKLINGFSQRMEGSSLVEIMKTCEPRIINDLEKYLAEHPDSHSTRLIVEEGIRSSLTCPLLSLGKPIGFIFFSSNHRNTYRGNHRRVFRDIANLLATIVEKSRLYEELYRLKCEIEQMRDAFKEQAARDALTGLWNRRALEELLTKEIARAVRVARPVAVIMIDIDHFKKVNDTFGHQAGDEILKEVARRLASVSREEDAVGRYGGEEFQIILSVADPVDVGQMAERYRSLIEATPVDALDNAVLVTISVGVGIGGGKGLTDGTSLVKLADEALYEAKASGRNRTVIKR